EESKNEETVLLFELKADLNAYLADLESSPVRTLAEIIAFNEAHAEEELLYFGQEHFLRAQETSSLTDATYLAALEENRRLAGREGIDAVMDEYKLDALVMPTISLPCRIDLVNGDHFAGGCSQPGRWPGIQASACPPVLSSSCHSALPSWVERIASQRSSNWPTLSSREHRSGARRAICPPHPDVCQKDIPD